MQERSKEVVAHLVREPGSSGGRRGRVNGEGPDDFVQALIAVHREKLSRKSKMKDRMDRLSFIAHHRWTKGWRKGDAEAKWDEIVNDPASFDTEGSGDSMKVWVSLNPRIADESVIRASLTDAGATIVAMQRAEFQEHLTGDGRLTDSLLPPNPAEVLACSSGSRDDDDIFVGMAGRLSESRGRSFAETAASNSAASRSRRSSRVTH